MKEIIDWDKFVELNWQKKPALFDLPDEPPMNEFDFLQAVHHLVNGELEASPRIRLFADGRNIGPGEEDGLISFVGTADIRSFAELVDIATSKLDSDTFTMILNDGGKLLPEVKEKLKDFLSSLTERVGVAPSFTDIELFGGSYKNTPFGIHRDFGNDNFIFGAVGEKRYLLWPPEYFSKELQENVDFQIKDNLIIASDEALAKFKEDALAFTVTPGTFLYMPDWWHVADVQANPIQLTLHLGLYSQVDLPSLGSIFMSELLNRRSENTNIEVEYSGEQKELPSFVSELVSDIKHIVSSGELEEHANNWWKTRRKNNGFS
ncbi:hypothetical protein L1077_25805 [Pseudoalteromonas luteoviolacea]|uniref:hypothetical protein n=1 Tax=Pseudoalteromonas luteoviolacea TaxID=43657 RepID=UPI001F1574A7|nr:hypothetical protein [Pseudoalteromonas luteoviolacea]MCF6442842.1 hypothetical protein [Pseudoalteromonas luteoviolacea]